MAAWGWYGGQKETVQHFKALRCMALADEFQRRKQKYCTSFFNFIKMTHWACISITRYNFKLKPPRHIKYERFKLQLDPKITDWKSDNAAKMHVKNNH